jgi:hypothetical protein
MKKITLRSSIIALSLSGAMSYAQEKDSLILKNSSTNPTTLLPPKALSSSESKEESNRNVMLNAANNTGPRDVNIGLPPNVGGITLLENDLPAVYFFWPELPTKVWRQSVGLEKVGLFKMDQLTNTMGDLGFAISSYSQTGTKELKVKGKFSTSTFGWLQGDINVSGPISKNGWTYTAGAFSNFDPNTFKLGFTRNADETKIFRLGLTKYFKNNKGKISLIYKYADSYTIGNNAVFQYGENGKITELDFFKIGRDSYVINDGRVKLLDILTGKNYWSSLNSKDNSVRSHTVDLFGNYLLNNGWDLRFSTRFHYADAALLTIAPIGISNASLAEGFRYASNGQAYAGNVGTQLVMHTPPTPITNIAGRFSLNKRIADHNLTVGLLEQYYNIDKFTSNRSFFYQTVEPNPQRLLNASTDQDGFFNYNAGGEYNSGFENKLSLYATDDWTVNDNFKLNYGLHFRNHIVNGDFSETPRTVGFTLQNAELTKINRSWFHIAGSVNATYNIVRNFGVLANYLHTEENRRLESYSTNFDPNTKKIMTDIGAFGLFWNTDFIQLISQVTYAKKNNILSRYNAVNPSNNSQVQNITLYYDIQTVGWTTDFVLKPFKGFNIHYLITLQNPVYKKFTFDAFGKNYNYNDNNVLSISKVLMEIDPSYTINKWRFWASFRYFSKQFANLTNVLYFAPRWETFGGVNYSVNKNISVGGTVVNFLNQRGASGSINGSELITDASPYYGRIMAGSYIMPLTGQLSISFNF